MKIIFRITYLIALFMLASCANTNTSVDKGSANVELETMHYLALGDSYTIGEAIDSSSNFPNQLVRELITQGYPFQPAKIIAKTGWRSDELLASMNKTLNEESRFELISILIGVNNQYQGNGPNDFRVDLKLIIEKAIEHSANGAKGIFAFSIPDYSHMPFMRGRDLEQISAEIDQYNVIYKETCEEKGIQFYDITKISDQAKFDSGLIANDKLHPSEKMYGIWVHKWSSQIIDDLLK